MKKQVLIIGSFFLLFLIISCVNKKSIIAKQGVIDLRKWDFEKDGIEIDE